LGWVNGLLLRQIHVQILLLALGEIFKNLAIITQASPILAFIFEVLDVFVIDAYLIGVILSSQSPCEK
jgi:hypothetical protein